MSRIHLHCIPAPALCQRHCAPCTPVRLPPVWAGGAFLFLLGGGLFGRSRSALSAGCLLPGYRSPLSMRNIFRALRSPGTGSLAVAPDIAALLAGLTTARGGRAVIRPISFCGLGCTFRFFARAAARILRVGPIFSATLLLRTRAISGTILFAGVGSVAISGLLVRLRLLADVGLLISTGLLPILTIKGLDRFGFRLAFIVRGMESGIAFRCLSA